MKVAVLGDGPCALAIALNLSQKEANVKLFPSVIDSAQYLKKHLKEHLKEHLNKEFIQLSEHQFMRVSKASLAPPSSDEINFKIRLKDLFRVIYQVKPKNTNIALGQYSSDLNSNTMAIELDEAYESFEDFDIFIDARDELHFSNPIGIGKIELPNEKKIAKSNRAFYGIHQKNNFIEGIKKNHKVAIVGSGEIAGESLIELIHSFQQKLEIILITSEEFPFKALMQKKPNLCKELKDVLESNESIYLKNLELYRNNMQVWKNLLDYERVKRQRPVSPNRQIDFKKSSYVSSIDLLSDRDGLFLTIDKIGDRLGQHQSIHIDLLFVGTGYKKLDNMLCYLEGKKGEVLHSYENEPGFYRFVYNSLQLSDEMLSVGLEELWQDLKKYFCKRAL